MADNRESIIIDVQVDAGKVATTLANATNALRTLKQEQKNLDKALEEGSISLENYGKAIAQNKAEQEQASRTIKSATAQLQAYDIQAVSLTGTLDEQRQALNTLQKAYGTLTEEQKNATVNGQTLTERINELSDSVKEQEGAIGDFRRNVGNYAGGIQEAFGNMAQAAQELGPAKDVLQQMGPEGQKAARALDILAKVMKMTSVYGKAITATTKAQTAATAAQTGAQWNLNAAMDANPIGVIIAAITALISAVKAMVSAFNDATAETDKLNAALEANDRIMKALEKDAEFEARMAAATGASAQEQIRIRRAAAQQSLTIAENEVFELQKIMREGNRKEKKAAHEKYQDALDAAKQAAENLNKLNQDMTVQRAQDDYKANQEQIKRDEDAAKAREAAAKKRNEDAKKAAAERLKNEEEIARMAEDFALSLITDETEKAIAARKIQGDREIEQLQKRLETEKNLTEQSREQLAELIKGKQDALNAELQKMADDAAKAKTDADLEREQKQAEELLQYRLQLAQEGSAEELELKKQQLDLELQQALEATELEEEEKYIIREAFKQKAIQLDKEYHDSLVKQAGDAKEQYKKSLMDTAKNASTAFDAMSSLLEEYGKDNEKAAAASKAFGIAKIITDQAVSIADTAKAISAAVAGATEAASAGGPAAPFLLAGYIAAMVGAVLGAVASVAGSIQQARQLIGGADAGNFAQGGIVGGSSYTGDRMVAHVNSREAIITPRQQANLLELANGGKAAFDYDAMAAVMVAAVAAQPAPVMDYAEFTDFQQKTATYNEIAAI